MHVFAAVDVNANPWAYAPHPEVWLLIAFLAGAYTYVIRVLGPRAVAPGEQVTTRRQMQCAVAAIVLLWLVTDWPIHDISEKYLYCVHMLQHMALAYFIPPLALLGTPEWFARAVVGSGRGYRALRWLSKPVIAGVAFNAVVMVSHIPDLVNRSAENTPLHYVLHVWLVTMALLMWNPVCGPFAEMRMGYGARMIYLFLQSVVPTVPAGWLTFAEGVVYKHYDIPVRVFGLSATYDQQMAGLIMKIGGGMFLWSIVIYLFFKRFAAQHADANTYRRSRQLGDAKMIDSAEEPLTYETVAEAFERHPAPAEPTPPRH